MQTPDAEHRDLSHRKERAETDNLQGAKKMRGFYALPDHEKFQRSVGSTIGLKGVIAGFFRVPRTAILFLSRASKWRL